MEFPTPIMFIERYIQVGAFRFFARGVLDQGRRQAHAPTVPEEPAAWLVGA